MVKYYLSFTPYSAAALSSGGGTLFEVSDVGFGATQTLAIGSQSSGSGAGKIAFDPLTFTTQSSALTVQLDAMLASGTPFAQVNLYAFDTRTGSAAVPVLHDVFKLAAKSDTVDVASGNHQVVLEYGGLVESSVPLAANGSTGTPVTAGWNRVTNTSDSTLNTALDGTPVNLPPVDPAKDAVPSASSGPRDLYVRFTGYDNSVLGGGWIPLASAGLGLTQTLAIGSQSSGSGAGKVAFDPLTLSFAPGTVEPTLFKDQASGTPFKQVEIAAYKPGTGATPGTLTDDYLFGLAAVQTSSHTVTSGTPSQTYTLQYGTEQIQHATIAPDGQATTTSEGWDATKNVKLATTAIGATTTDTSIKANLAPIATGETDTPPAVCFVTGTQIHTTRGNFAVEDLVVGDVVVTASGDTRPIVWIGHREIRCRGRHALHPIRVAANAFGDNRPARALWLSPGHPVLVGADLGSGHLVPIMCLVNGTTIERVAVDSVTYWHVELDQHDVLLAEGLPAESYLDWGDRAFFSEAADHALANPDFIVPGLANRCRPVAIDGPIVEAERRRLDGLFAIGLMAQCAWPALTEPEFFSI